MKKFFNYFTILTLAICLMKMGKKLMPKKLIRLYDNFYENWRRKKIDLLFMTVLTNQSKNEDVNEKIWENEFDL